MNVLITGGAGFIGSHLADELLRRGDRVRALDNLSPQVHGPNATRPAYLNRDIELLVGDVRDPEAVGRALEGIDAVYHFASMVGVGQSMYEVGAYTSVNDLGTAVLLEALIRTPVRRLVIASSMSVYGEGLYRDSSGNAVTVASRSVDRLRAGEWEPRGPNGSPLESVATPETKSVTLESVYALSKYTQERMCLLLGRAYGIPTVALRFFNVYGTRQALSNPYTGVLAIFAARLLNGKPPLIFEDGRQQRDFVSVHDIVQACILALQEDAAVGHVLNVGTGRPRTVIEVAEHMAAAVGKPHIAPEITGRCRMGDVRHCFADIREASRVLGYVPSVEFDTGLAELAIWLGRQIATDRVAEARAELDVRGLTL